MTVYPSEVNEVVSGFTGTYYLTASLLITDVSKLCVITGNVEIVECHLYAETFREAIILLPSK